MHRSTSKLVVGSWTGESMVERSCKIVEKVGKVWRCASEQRCEQSEQKSNARGCDIERVNHAYIPMPMPAPSDAPALRRSMPEGERRSREKGRARVSGMCGDATCAVRSNSCAFAACIALNDFVLTVVVEQLLDEVDV